jgi:hypothetical protein
MTLEKDPAGFLAFKVVRRFFLLVEPELTAVRFLYGSARWPGGSGRAVLGLRGGHLVVSASCRRGAARGLKLCAMQTRRGENLKFVLPCWVASDLHAAAAARPAAPLCAAMVQEAPLKIYARGVVSYFYFPRAPRAR